MAVSTAFFMLAEKVFVKVFYPSYYQYCKEKNDVELRKFKTMKAVKSTFKFFYYIYSSVIGYIMLKDSYVLPPCLGGSGSFME